MNILPLAPVLTCLLVFTLNTVSWRTYNLQRIFHLFGAVALLVVAGVVLYQTMQHDYLVLQIGGYAAPFGISFVIDLFSALMIMVTAIVGFCVSIYSIEDVKAQGQRAGFYLAYWVLLLGIVGALSTGDLFNLYVWFEIMLIASFILLVLDNKNAQIDGTLKYVGVNLVATILMLLAIAMLYGLTGTLNFADLALKIAATGAPGTMLSVILLLTLAFSVKAALFPLFFWLPASYHTTNVTTAAICAGMLTKVGIYALVRVMTLLYPSNHYILGLLLFSAGATMLTGVLGAASQFHFRRLLSFHIISQLGYMVMGLAIYTPLAVGGMIFFMIHNIFVKTNLFLISGVCTSKGGTNDIRKLGGMYKELPVLAFLFFISAFSMAGIPPFSGFWGKLVLLQASITTAHYLLAAMSILVGFFTLFSMIKIWNQVFWKAGQDRPVRHPGRNSKTSEIAYIPIVILVLISLSMGLMPKPYFDLNDKIADQLLHHERYIEAVLGKGAR